HWCFGHIGVKGLQQLQHKGLVDGLIMLPSLNIDCTTCIEAKQSRMPFPTTSEV
ncbi:hypothetical protein SCLCIDRAFT_124787, partial [Scleroderma citrinum Foug A]